MSNFFEKLTSSQTTDDKEEAVLASSSAKTAKRPTFAKDDRPTRLKVDTGDQAMEEDEDEEEIAEEEGELTVDIYDKGDEICIQSTVAGVKPEDLDVSISSDTVTIKGKRERQEEVREDNYYYKELFWGTFSRSVILPEEIDDERAEASLKHGLLSIRLPKKKRGGIQKLKVKLN